MRIALDTNILISAFVLDSAYLLRLIDVLAEKHTIILSAYVVAELKTVTRRKFPLQYEKIEVFLGKLPFEMVYTSDKIEIEKYPNVRDKKDLPVLVSAIMAEADILLTGDSDFSAVEIARPKIMNARDFLEKYS
jgi:putative PIN family toxin of toxin-antitoxin system